MLPVPEKASDLSFSTDGVSRTTKERVVSCAPTPFFRAMALSLLKY